VLKMNKVLLEVSTIVDKLPNQLHLESFFNVIRFSGTLVL